MTLLNLIEAKRTAIRRLARKHGATHLRVFGSHASGRATTESDLDILVELAPDRDLLDLIGLKLDLEDLLGCRVDTVTRHPCPLIFEDAFSGRRGPCEGRTPISSPYSRRNRADRGVLPRRAQ